MPIAVSCPSCGSKVKAPGNAAGKRVKCPKCSEPNTVPAPEGASRADNGRVADFSGVADLPERTSHPPRSPEKVEVMIGRAGRKQQLFSPLDAGYAPDPPAPRELPGQDEGDITQDTEDRRRGRHVGRHAFPGDGKKVYRLGT
jgi:hypothetical protein